MFGWGRVACNHANLEAVAVRSGSEARREVRGELCMKRDIAGPVMRQPSPIQPLPDVLRTDISVRMMRAWANTQAAFWRSQKEIQSVHAAGGPCPASRRQR